MVVRLQRRLRRERVSRAEGVRMGCEGAGSGELHGHGGADMVELGIRAGVSWGKGRAAGGSASEAGDRDAGGWGRELGVAEAGRREF